MINHKRQDVYKMMLKGGIPPTETRRIESQIQRSTPREGHVRAPFGHV